MADAKQYKFDILLLDYTAVPAFDAYFEGYMPRLINYVLGPCAVEAENVDDAFDALSVSETLPPCWNARLMAVGDILADKSNQKLLLVRPVGLENVTHLSNRKVWREKNIEDGTATIEQIEWAAMEAGPFESPDNIEMRITIEQSPVRDRFTTPTRRVIAEPTNRGKRSPKYLAEKARLDDDWAVDLTEAVPEIWLRYMKAAGVLK